MNFKHPGIVAQWYQETLNFIVVLTKHDYIIIEPSGKRSVPESPDEGFISQQYIYDESCKKYIFPIGR